MNKHKNRLRRARKTRLKIAQMEIVRLSVFRTNSHIYAQLINPTDNKVLATASTLELGFRAINKSGGNVEAAIFVGKQIAERAKAFGIENVAFDRSGFKYHGRVKALAESARANGLVF